MGSIPIRSIGVDFGKRIEVTSLFKVSSILADSAYSVSIGTCDMEDPHVCQFSPRSVKKLSAGVVVAASAICMISSAGTSISFTPKGS